MFYVVAISGALLGGLIVWLFLAGRHAAVAERLRSTTSDHERASDELNSLRAETAKLSIAHAQLSTQLAAERDAQVRLTNEFKALSADALSRNNTSFLELARETFSTLQK